MGKASKKKRDMRTKNKLARSSKASPKPGPYSKIAIKRVTGLITRKPLEIIYTPLELADTLNSLFHIANKPREIIRELKPLLLTYPNQPRILNMLTASYEAIGEDGRALEYAKLNYETNPSYSFARIDYSEMLIKAGNMGEAQLVFERKISLFDLFPERELFHVGEVLGYTRMLVKFFTASEEPILVWSQIDFALSIDAEHPITQSLKPKAEHPRKGVALSGYLQ